MEIFREMEDYACREIHLCHDPVSGLKGVIAIHSTQRGPALGGARYLPYEKESDVLEDALRLSRAMTYKAALADLPMGGGKTVLIRPKNLNEAQRQAQMKAFGRFLETLGGRYITSEDSGSNSSDMAIIAKETRYVSGASGRGGDPSPLTATGVRRGIEAAAKFVFSKDSLSGVRVAIQGVGNVGAHLARDLSSRGCRLFVSDIDTKRAKALAEELQATLIPVSEIFDVETDIFAPCALGGALSEQTVPRLRCKIVAGAANNQLASPSIADLLLQKNILYAPDYAINAGGLLQVSQEWSGYDDRVAKERCERIYDTLLQIFERSAKEEKSPAVIAEIMAKEALR